MSQPARVLRSQGDVAAAMEAAAQRLSADYYVPHLSQSPMEPMAAVAEWRDGAVEIWAPTQHPIGMRDEIARVLEVDPSRVTVHVTFLGGGFGRKSKPDFGVEAALLARAAGRTGARAVDARGRASGTATTTRSARNGSRRGSTQRAT